ncbi:MAG: hypothetical protein R2711_11225 [Acidimicrobiales bacterium]
MGELAVEVIGEQWFWRVGYPGTGVVTANEIHLPVDRPVDLALRSTDVIHSFWVPLPAGKLDLIPGQTNHLRFTLTEVGRFRGECAEFCGSSTPTWRSWSWWSRRRSPRAVDRRPRRRARAAARGQRRRPRPRGLRRRARRRLPHHRGRQLGAGRARPDDARRPLDARRRHPAQRSRRCGRGIRDPDARRNPAPRCRRRRARC